MQIVRIMTIMRAAAHGERCCVKRARVLLLSCLLTLIVRACDGASVCLRREERELYAAAAV